MEFICLACGFVLDKSLPHLCRHRDKRVNCVHHRGTVNQGNNHTPKDILEEKDGRKIRPQIASGLDELVRHIIHLSSLSPVSKTSRRRRPLLSLLYVAPWDFLIDSVLHAK